MDKAYTAALETAVYYPLPHSGLLRVSGADRAAFIQRQTTNDIRQLSAGHVHARTSCSTMLSQMN